MASARQEKTVLTNPEPYHTPGYCGFCPQFKFQIGETFGRTTTRLLTNPKVPKSGRSLLADLKPACPDYPAREISAGQPSIRSRKASFGDQKFTEHMVPGYTGYIPKSQHFYGNRYAEICREAVSEFEGDQEVERKKRDNMKTVQCVQAGREDVSNLPQKYNLYGHRSPLRKLPGAARGRVSYNTLRQQHSLSPYYMENENPQKCFMSGYTGFVPNARGLTGMSYPILTKCALITFTNDPRHPMAKTSSKSDEAENGAKLGKSCRLTTLPPDKEKRQENVRRFWSRQLPVIYPIDSGLVPHYTGHIPGQKFRYGTTFGHSTRNAHRIELKPTKNTTTKST